MSKSIIISIKFCVLLFLLSSEVCHGQLYSIQVPPPENEVRNSSLYGGSVEIFDSMLVIGASFGGDWSPNEEHVFVLKEIDCNWEVLKHWKSASFASEYMGAKLGVNSEWIAFSEKRGGCKVNLFKYEDGDFVKKQELSGGYCDLTHFSNLAMNNDFLMVGNIGSVKVYEFEEDGVNLVQTLTGNDGFGEMVALSDDKMIISRRLGFTGSADVYHYNGIEWVKIQTLSPNDVEANHNFATSVSIKGDYAFVADHNFNFNFPSDVSKVYIYKSNSQGVYQQIDVLQHPTSNTNISNFGADVNMDDQYLYIASNISNTTSIYTYENDDFEFVREISGGDDIAIANGLVFTGYGRYSANGFNKGTTFVHTPHKQAKVTLPTCILPFEFGSNLIADIDDRCPLDTLDGEEPIQISLDFYDSICDDDTLFTCRYVDDVYLQNFSGFETVVESEYYQLDWMLDTIINGVQYNASDFLNDTTILTPYVKSSAPNSIVNFTLNHYILGVLVGTNEVLISVNNDVCSNPGLGSDIEINYGDAIKRDLDCDLDQSTTVRWIFSEEYYSINEVLDNGGFIIATVEELSFVPPSSGYIYFSMSSPNNYYCAQEEFSKVNVVLVDLDNDGFTNDVDCDDNNPDINPDAEEVANNGIDEDCDGEDLITSSVDTPKSKINIYPNPVSSILRIETSSDHKFKVNIFTMSGESIFEAYNRTSIPVTELSNGVYLLEFQDINSGQKIIEKIVVNN